MFATTRTLWRVMRGQRLRYAGALAAMSGGALVVLLQPLVMGGAIDFAITGTPPARAPQFFRDAVEAMGGRSVLAQNLWIVAVALVAVMTVSGVLNYLRGRWSATASEAIVGRLRDELYDQLQHLPATYHDLADTGDLVQRCSSDVETTRMFLAQHVVEIGRALVLLVGVGPVMFWLHPTMAAWSMVLVVPIVVFATGFYVRARRQFQTMDEAEGAMTARVQENLTGIRVVRAFARGAYENRRFAERNDDYRNQWYRLMVVMAWFWSASDLMCLTQLGIVLVAGAWHVMAGAITAGTFLAFWMLVNQFLWPVRHMGRVLSELGKATVALGRIEEILEAEPEPSDASVTEQASREIAGRIRFEDVSFAHGGEHPVLRGVSFEVEAGQTVALLGPSGSGKSTMINLLLRLYDFEEGSIRLDGTDIRELPRKFVRSQIGVVMQEPFLYSRSIRENIKLGRSRARDEELLQASRDACIHQSIAEFEDGYDTVVGERGVTLSGGQRQRVAIARALLKDPPILILDDALSAVDTQTESLILEALTRRRGRHTTVVIAHRLSTLKRADLILVLDHGRVIQRGLHEELVSQPGLYQRLWEIQSSLEDDLQAEAKRSLAQPAGG